MSEKLRGQVRHVLTLAGGAIAGEPVLAGTLEDSVAQIVAGVAVALIGHVWSWFAKRGQPA